MMQAVDRIIQRGNIVHNPGEPEHRAAAGPLEPVIVTIVSADGIRRLETTAELQSLVSAGKFFWLDIVGADPAAREAFLSALELEKTEVARLQRFGQTGRMMIDHQQLFAVTWLAEHGQGLQEIHLLCKKSCMLTVWNGNPGVLNEIREIFAERSAELEKSFHHAAGILLQLLLGTLQQAISEVDERYQALEMQLGQRPETVDFPALVGRFQTLKSAWSNVDRYSSAVRTAIVGVEALPGIDQRGAKELNDYADQLNDVEHRLHGRSEWTSKMAQDYATGIAKRQSEQINRLTIVSLIFLPITFLTGFFGMNFTWMMQFTNGPMAFLILGVLLPALIVIFVVMQLRRRDLL